MKIVQRLVSHLTLVVMLAAASAMLATPASAAGRYVCPPCSAPCDTMHFDGPGTCPRCGMALVEAGSSSVLPDPARKKIAILLFDGVEIMDYTGPYEMFGAAGCDVYTVAENTHPITTAMGMVVMPKYSFADAPQPDVLVVPGGGVKAASESAATLQYVKSATAGAQHTMSVCNGAFILAHAGLLDGLTATTTAGNIERLAKQFPNTKVVRDQRVVDNGKIFTAGGLSAGIDGALHVISKLMGEGTAQSVALGEEYNWEKSAAFTRAMLADLEIPNINVDGLGHWDVVSTHGNNQHWELVFSGSSHLSEADLMRMVSQALAEQGRWTPAEGGKSAGATNSAWKFTGRDGHPWSGTFTIESVAGEPNQYRGVFTVARSS
ncbi:MAG: DJ-1/PfpI family protein [Candidatus Eiseniibacteriota bacterium]